MHIPPGTVLADRVGHYWIRRAKMVISRHRFISYVGDDTEKYYQQKYLLSVPMTEDHEVVLNPPKSWVELCAESGMCDAHLDAFIVLLVFGNFKVISHRPAEVLSTVVY